MFHQELQTRLWKFEATACPPLSPRASVEEGKPEPPSTRSPTVPREPAPCTAQAPCSPRALAALSLTPTLSPFGAVDTSSSVLARLPKLLDECVPGKMKGGKRQIETTEDEKVGRALRSRFNTSAVDGQVDDNVLCR